MELLVPRFSTVVIAVLAMVGSFACSAKARADEAAYCGRAFAGYDSGNRADPTFPLRLVRENCSVGDTLLISSEVGSLGPILPFLIAQLCDFSKAIVVNGGVTICVLGNPRAER